MAGENEGWVDACGVDDIEREDVRPFDHGVGADLHVPPGPATGAGLAAETLDGPQAFHNAGVEHRLVRGTRFESPGPATDWIRLTFPLVAGRETTPLERVVVAADFGNGVSRLFGMDDVLFLNPDLTVQFEGPERTHTLYLWTIREAKP